jgi:hypothetical protein
MQWKHVFPGHPRVGSGVIMRMTPLWDHYFLVYKDDLEEGHPAVYFSATGELLHRFRLPALAEAFAASDRALLVSSANIDTGAIARVYNRKFELIRRIPGPYGGGDAVFEVLGGKRLFGLFVGDEKGRHVFHATGEDGTVVWSLPLPEKLENPFFLPGRGEMSFCAYYKGGMGIFAVEPQAVRQICRLVAGTGTYLLRDLFAFLDDSTVLFADAYEGPGDGDAVLYVFDLGSGRSRQGVLAGSGGMWLQRVRRITEDSFLIVTLDRVFIISRDFRVLASYAPDDGGRSICDVLPAPDGGFVVCGREPAEDGKEYAFIAKLERGAFVKMQ